jgi:hypothetical protein
MEKQLGRGNAVDVGYDPGLCVLFRAVSRERLPVTKPRSRRTRSSQHNSYVRRDTLIDFFKTSRARGSFWYTTTALKPFAYEEVGRAARGFAHDWRRRPRPWRQSRLLQRKSF